MWTFLGSLSVAVVGVCAGGGVPAPGAPPTFQFDESALTQALPPDVVRVWMTAAPDETSGRALPDATRAITSSARQVVPGAALPGVLPVTPGRDRIVEICAGQSVDAVARVQILTVRDHQVAELRLWDCQGTLLAAMVGQPPRPRPDPLAAAREVVAEQELPAEEPGRLQLQLAEPGPSGLRRAVTITGGVLTVTGLVLTSLQALGSAVSAPFEFADSVTSCPTWADSGGLDQAPSGCGGGSGGDSLSVVPAMITVVGAGMWLSGAYLRF
jgi:hypothetical protein